MNTNPLSTQAWLAAHLYYNEPWEAFLQKAVAPFVQQIMAEQLAEQFFFIRYWEKGPHIRLRFKGNAQILESRVKPALVKYFSNYFTTQPSHRTEPSWLTDVPAAYQWYPNNSIQFIPYEPELERYGGDIGILIAERLFQASSEAVLAVLREKPAWDYNQALGVAIELHLGFAFAAGMDLPETVAFFSSVFCNWLPRAFAEFPANLSAEALEAKQDEALRAFRNTYEKQKTFLVPLFTQIWHALENSEDFEQVWFTNWLSKIYPLSQELRQVQANGNLDKLGWSSTLPPGLIVELEKQQRWAIYDSFIHMTNNRLGILNRDEGYLGYLIKEGLTEMAHAVA